MTTDNCGRLIKEEEEEAECKAVQMIISKYESEPKQVKREDLIDVVDHDLKSERYLEEVKEASHCEVCGGLFGPIDFFSSDHWKFCCQCQKGSNTMQEEYMTVDLKPFASDDTLLACYDTSLDKVIETMNAALRDVNEYLLANKLKLNEMKIKGMIITTKNKRNNHDLNEMNIQIDNENIEIVSCIKYLGFQLDNLLLFGNHLDYICKKISKELYFFARISGNLSTQSKITVFNAIIQPHFDYCASLIFLFNLNQTSQLRKLQNRSMRIVLIVNRFTEI
nr:uncharacterized protein LOC111506426 [Leptinotarsa decemlineata]